MIPPSEQDRAFAEYLRTLAHCGGSRVLATLARTRPGSGSLRPLQWLGPWTLNVGPGEAQRRLLVAGLFALHPHSGHTRSTGRSRSAGHAGNMGTVFARLRRVRGSTASLDQRFVALLEAHREDLPGHLRRAVGLARSAEVNVDWAQLLADLRLWDHLRQLVQRAWATEYWAETETRSGEDAEPSA
ncbi:MAG: type I-E CRISPR-associated protein Cse2/CasB [Armatimonadota bacterium]